MFWDLWLKFISCSLEHLEYVVGGQVFLIFLTRWKGLFLFASFFACRTLYIFSTNHIKIYQSRVMEILSTSYVLRDYRPKAVLSAPLLGARTFMTSKVPWYSDIPIAMYNIKSQSYILRGRQDYCGPTYGLWYSELSHTPCSALGFSCNFSGTTRHFSDFAFASGG